MGSVQILFGPILIGVFLNTILFGILILQTFIYFQMYKRDSPWIRYLVLYLFIAETLNSAFDIAMVYEPLVARFGEARATIISPKMLSADAIVTVAISTPVQLFIAWRIKVISQSTALTSLISIFAISSFAGGVATTVSVTIAPEFANFKQFQWAVITWLASSALADILITGGLVWSLYNRKKGFSAMDDIINRIIRLTVQTGIITTVAAIADFTFFLILPHTSLNFLFDLPLSKLYTNSLLSTLNARAGWKTLMSQQNAHNVLFGEQHSSDWRSTGPTEVSSYRPRVPTKIYPLHPAGVHEQHPFEDGVSKLDLESR